MQELPGRHDGFPGGFAVAADHHRRLRLRGSERIRDIEPDRRGQVRDDAQDRDRAREIEGRRATKAARAEEGSARVPERERNTCRAGGATGATGARERGKSAGSPIASIDRSARGTRGDRAIEIRRNLLVFAQDTCSFVCTNQQIGIFRYILYLIS